MQKIDKDDKDDHDKRQQVGPIGDGGASFDDWAMSLERGPLRRLRWKRGDIIDDVAVLYGDSEISHLHHDGLEGYEEANVDFTEDPLVRISGWYGNYYGANHFFELSFHTRSGKTIRAVGSGRQSEGERFELSAPEGHGAVAFFGNTFEHSDGSHFLSALGFWALPFAETANTDAAPRLPGFRSDAVDAAADDLLGIQRDVDALCAVVASSRVYPPLSVGLFGDWGSGKSFFMAKLRRRIDELAHAAKRSDTSAFCRDVVHVEFNAWHFNDANLWASLVTHIYDKLFAHIQGHESEEEIRRRLDMQLEGAKQNEEAARAELAKAEALLAEAKRERKEKEQRYDNEMDNLEKLLTAEPAIAASLDVASKALGLPALADSFGSLSESAQKLRAASTRWAVLGRMVLASPVSKIVIPMIAASVVVPAAIHALLERFPEIAQSINKYAAMLGGTLSTAALWVSTLVKRVSTYVSTIEEALAKAEKERELRKEKERKEGGYAAYDEALAKEAAAKKALEEARARARELQEQLAERHPQRRLARLIEARATSDEYRKHLGIISAIRKDFEAMSAALGPPPTAENPHPMRVMLYIDDLDRCRPERVVEVLEAIHMLLAYPLFVVVVAVDPRWLRRCLETRLPTLLGETSNQGGDRVATSQDYLEKIFQIPFTLRRVNHLEAGFDRMMSDLLGPVSARGVRQTVSSTFAPATSTQPSVYAPDKQQTTDSIVQFSAPAAGAPAEKAANKVVDPLLCSSELLEFTADEHRDVTQLGRLFRTPRTVKRFVNIYRLIRARIAPHDLGQFLDNHQYRAALVLLAVVTAYPNLSGRFLNRLLWWLPKNLERDPLSSWNDFLETLEVSAEKLDKLEKLAPGKREPRMAELRAERLLLIGDDEWRAMCHHVRTVLDPMPLPFPESVIELWALEVSRFSFSYALSGMG